jgi:hypothetical protein
MSIPIPIGQCVIIIRGPPPLACARPAPDLRGAGRSHWPSEVLCFLRVHGPVRSFTRATPGAIAVVVAPPLFSWYSQVLPPPRCFSSELTSPGIVVLSAWADRRDRRAMPIHSLQTGVWPSSKWASAMRYTTARCPPSETVPVKGEGSQTLPVPRPRRTGVHFPLIFINPWQLTTPTGGSTVLRS